MPGISRAAQIDPARLDALTQALARPGEGWASAAVRATRLLHTVRTCTPCPLCAPEERALLWARYRIRSGWVDDGVYGCPYCEYALEDDAVEAEMPPGQDDT